MQKVVELEIGLDNYVFLKHFCVELFFFSNKSCPRISTFCFRRNKHRRFSTKDRKCLFLNVTHWMLYEGNSKKCLTLLVGCYYWIWCHHQKLFNMFQKIKWWICFSIKRRWQGTYKKFLFICCKFEKYIMIYWYISSGWRSVFLTFCVFVSFYCCCFVKM